MRSNQNPSGSVTRSVGDRAAGARSVADRNVVAKLSMPQMPVEWLDAGSWRLPSGKALAEFALQAGFLAPLLFRADRFGKSSPSGSPEMPRPSGIAEPSDVAGSIAQARGKQLGKGDSR
jgi:hypothetical protein